MADANLSSIATALEKALRTIQEASGRSFPEVFDQSLRPIGDLEGFDSVNGVEATVLVEAELGCTLGVDNVFVLDDQALPLGAIVQKMLAKIEGSRQ